MELFYGEQLELQHGSCYDNDYGFQYINWMVNNLGAKPLTSSLLKVKVKAVTEQNQRQQHPLLSGLGEVHQVLTLSSPTAEPSYSTEFKS